MKIAILNNVLINAGGIEDVVRTQARLLVTKGKHKVSCFVGAGDANLFSDVDLHRAVPKLPFLSDRLNRVYSSTFMFLRLKPSKFRNYDYLIAHYQPSSWIALQVKKKYGIPYVYYAHGPFRNLYPTQALRKSKIFCFTQMLVKLARVKQIDIEAAQKANYVLASSKSTAKEVEEAYSVRTEILYPSIDVDFFKKTTISRNKEPFLLFVGRHDPYKKIEWAIDVFDIVRKEFPELNLVICGQKSSRYSRVLEKKVRDMSLMTRVSFISPQKRELVRLYSDAECLLFSSIKEDFGLVILESMACETPVIAWNDNAGPTESVINGETGFLAKPYDLSDFASKVSKLLSDEQLRLKMGLASRKRVLKNFSWKKHFKILESKLLNQ
jgi:glycosyltransferase involved in cell wall biosynthesis